MKAIDFSNENAPFSGQDWEQAYESVKPELMALPREQLITIKLDIPAAVATAAGVIPEIADLRSQIQRELPSFEIERFDNLPKYAMAAGHAHSVVAVSAGPSNQLRAIYEEAGELRELLRSDAVALSKRGLINPASLSNIGGLLGFKNVYADLRNLVTVFRTNWSSVDGKCATTQEEVDRAAALSSALVQAVGLREQGPPEISELSEMRVRAFSMFVGTYQEVRRAVAYLRWNEGDVDSIIPSLYATRTRRTKKVESPEPEVEETQNEAGTADETRDETPSATLPVASNVRNLREQDADEVGSTRAG